jgi:hypothetical protein
VRVAENATVLSLDLLSPDAMALPL